MSERRLRDRCGHGYHHDGHSYFGDTVHDWCDGGAKVVLESIPWCASHNAELVYFDDDRFEGGLRCLDADCQACRVEDPPKHWVETGDGR